jgi:nucleotide-binding universal stress UspA family protein
VYKTVLVTLDGSPLAERALPYGAALAQAGYGRLVLVRAAAAPTMAELETCEELLAVTQEETKIYLHEMVARLEEQRPGIERRTEKVVVPVRHGSVAEALRRIAREQGADVVIMATHGRSGLGRWLYGSVADDVLRHAEVPVLLVPATAGPLWSPGAGQRILVPLDGSPLALAALPAAAELAAVLRADLHLLRVVEPPASLRVWDYTSPAFDPAAEAPADPAADVAGATKYLEGVAATLRARGHAVRFSAEVGLVAPTIAAVAEEQHASAIVMATHGRGGVARVVLGSVATGVLQRAGVPLLLVRPEAVRLAEREDQEHEVAGADVGSMGAPAGAVP